MLEQGAEHVEQSCRDDTSDFFGSLCGINEISADGTAFAALYADSLAGRPMQDIGAPIQDRMFERYTERARQLIPLARYEAAQLGSMTIETEHLLLGLIESQAKQR